MEVKQHIMFYLIIQQRFQHKNYQYINAAISITLLVFLFICLIPNWIPSLIKLKKNPMTRKGEIKHLINNSKILIRPKKSLTWLHVFIFLRNIVTGYQTRSLKQMTRKQINDLEVPCAFDSATSFDDHSLQLTANGF